MFRIYKVTLALLAFAGMASVGLIVARLVPLHTSKHANEIDRSRTTPAQKVRESVTGIKASDIDSIEFTGVDMSVNPIIVTDPVLVSQFLQALRYADTEGDDYTDRSEMMQIKLAARTGSRWLSYYFTPYQASERYGPQFQDALHKLSKFEVNQVSRDVQANASNIRAVDFHFKMVTKPDDIHKIISALTQLNENDFDYTASNASMFAMTLQIKNKKAVEVCLCVSSIEHLPAVLQPYFAESQKI